MANVQIQTVSPNNRTSDTKGVWFEPTPTKSSQNFRITERPYVTVTPEGVSVDPEIAAQLVTMHEDIDYVAKTKKIRPNLT